MRAHDGDRRAYAVDGTEDVDPERPLPVLGREVVNATVRREHPGVADQDVEAAEAPDRTPDDGFDLSEVAHVSQEGLDAERSPTFYYAVSQKPSSAMVVTLRTNGDPTQWMNAARRQVSALDRNVPIQSLRTGEDWLGATLQRRRFATLLLGLFGGLAMLLAAVGIYGVLNYWVSARQREIAIRLTLGAQRSSILRWAGLHATRLAVFGIVLGAIGAWSASRWLKSLVFGVTERSPLMMLLAGAAVIVIAGLAASVPLWRATHTDPVRNLHEA